MTNKITDMEDTAVTEEMEKQTPDQTQNTILTEEESVESNIPMLS